MSNRISNFPNAQKQPPDVVRTEVEIFKEISDLPPVDTRSPKEIKKRINEYLNICLKEGITPTVQGVSLALHIHRSTFWTWCKENSERGSVCQDFKTLQAGLTEELMYSGKINIVGGIFLLKANHSYRDAVSIDLDSGPAFERLPTAEDIRKRLGLIGQITESDT